MSELITKTFTFEGKRYYVRAKTERQCYEKMVLKKLELEQGYNRISKNTLVKDWCEEWLTVYKAPAVSATWYKRLCGICKNQIIPNVGHMQLKDVRSLHLQKILNSCTDYSKSFLGKIFTVMNELFRTAKINNLINDNPMEGVILPAGKKATTRRSLTKSERKYLLEVADEHPHGLFIKIMLYCGLRPGEAAALRWMDLDFKKKILKIARAVKPDGTIGDPKTDAGVRNVPIPEVLLRELTKEKGNPFDLVCTNKKGELLTSNAIRRIWDSIIYNMNIKAGCKTYKKSLIPPLRIADDLVMYCLRHTYCTDLQAAGVPINVAKELMGHSSIAITAKIYTHSSEESFQNAADLINKLTEKRDELTENII